LHNQRLDLGFFEQFFFQNKSISRVTSGLKELRDTRGPGRIFRGSTGVAKFRATGQGIDEFWAWLALLMLGILKRIPYLRDSQDEWENEKAGFARLKPTLLRIYFCHSAASP